MKNNRFYSKVLAMSMMLGQMTPFAQAVTTESNIPGATTINPFANFVDTQENVDSSSQSTEKNDEIVTENSESNSGTASSQDTATQEGSESGDVTADTSWYDKDEDEYTLENLADFLGFVSLVNDDGEDFKGKTVTLDTDLDLSGMTWIPIGNDGNDGIIFKGTFDGGQKTISNLTVPQDNENSVTHQGLFYWLDSDAVVKNVMLTNVNIIADTFVGGIAALNYGTIQNCGVTGTLLAEAEVDGHGSSIGGLVGKNLNGGTIENCFNQASVTGGSRVGGIVGHHESTGEDISTITNVYNMGVISGTSMVGSLVGYNDGDIGSSYWLTGEDILAVGSGSQPTDSFSFSTDGELDLPDTEEEGEDGETTPDVTDPDTEEDDSTLENSGVVDVINPNEGSGNTNTGVLGGNEDTTLPESSDSQEDSTESEVPEEDEEGVDEGYVFVLGAVIDGTATTVTDYLNGWVEAQGYGAGYYTWVKSNGYPVFHQEHDYEWTYTTETSETDGTTLTASADTDGDDSVQVVLTLKSDIIYEGKELSYQDIFDMTKNEENFDLEEIFADLVYADEDDKDVVMNVGNYSATIGDVTVDFSVDKAELSLTWSGDTMKYTGTAQIPTVKVEGLVGVDAEAGAEEVEVTVQSDGDSIDVGTYTATATLENYKDNYQIAEKDQTYQYEITALSVITVQFDTGDGSRIESQVISENDVQKVTKPEDPSLTGYKFDGWYIDPQYTTAWLFDKEVSGNMTLYAKWLEELTITFDYDDGKTPNTTVTVYAGEKVTEPETPVRDKYAFLFWSQLSADGSYINFSFNDPITSSITLIAAWKSIHTVSFHYNDEDETVKTQQTLDNTTLTAPSNPTKEGYVFGGWFTDTACTQSWDFTKDVVTGDFNLYAKWTRQYTVSFDSQGGSSVISKRALEGGTVAQPTQPTLSEHYFMGWYQDPECTKPWNFTTDLVYGDMTLYALWDAHPSFSIRFETNGGSSVDTQYVLTDGLVEVPTEPSLTGYTFQGWFSDIELLFPWDFENDVVTTDMILYAKWDKIVYLTYGHVFDHAGNGFYGTQVYLYQNGKEIANTQADINGYFYFGDLNEGVYNIMYTIGTKSMTSCIEVFYQDFQELPDMFMTENQVTSTVTISPETSIHAVAGLDTTTKYLTASQGYYETFAIDLAISNIVDNSEKELIQNVISGYDRVIDFFDLTITMNKNSTGDKELNGTSNLIQVVMEIPFQSRYKDTYKVYRLHSDSLDMLTTTPNAIGEYIEVSYDRKFISIYTKNFSTYALTYVADEKLESTLPDGSQNGSSETRIYDITTQLRLNGNDTTDSSMGGVNYSTSFPVYGTTVVIMPEVNYGYKVDYVTAVTTSGESLPVSLSSDGNFRYTQGLSPVTITVAFISSKVETSYAQFTDVFPTDSYFYAVNRVVDAGLMTGTGNGTFSPHNIITRGMIVTILYNLSGENYQGEATFLDVMERDYFATAVAWAQENDIVMGYNDSTFRPNQGISREELAVIYHSYCNYAQVADPEWIYPTEYADNAEIADWAKYAVAWCMNQGLLDARFDNLYYPQAFGTRAEVAVSLLPLL